MLEARPRVISFTLGNPGDLVRQAHAVGALVMLQIITVAQAVQAAEPGVDVIKQVRPRSRALLTWSRGRGRLKP
jgi:NAD(P)H-dependent flavin oxidoreductase YrpB (nitropropane dioxygenase family)